MPEIYVSIGSCVNRRENVRAALKALRKRFGRVRYSSVYETEAVGFMGDPFYNLVVGFDSSDDTSKLKRFFRAVESRQGRRRDVKMPGRCPLDIDLLLYGDLVVDTPVLKLPRDDVLKHAFVLEPLAELVPDRSYPGTAITFQELWVRYCCRCDSKSLRLGWNPLDKPNNSSSWCYPDYTLTLHA